MKTGPCIILIILGAWSLRVLQRDISENKFRIP